MSKPSRVPRKRVRRGLWSPEEDAMLMNHIAKYGHGCWSYLPKLAGIDRCGKSCRLRWLNYLRPDLKRGALSQDEEDAIIRLHSIIGNRWSQITARLPGRTDNEVKNFWHSFIKKKLRRRGIDPITQMPVIAEQHILPSVDPQLAHLHPAVTGQSCMCIRSNTAGKVVPSEGQAQHILPWAIPPAATVDSNLTGGREAARTAVLLVGGVCSDAALALPDFTGYLDPNASGIVQPVVPIMAGPNPSATGACAAAFPVEQWSNRTYSGSQSELTRSGTASATNQLPWPIGGSIDADGAALDDLEPLRLECITTAGAIGYLN